jgi:hypothetical protein
MSAVRRVWQLPRALFWMLRSVFRVKSFQTALQKLHRLGRFKDNNNTFAARNDLAFTVPGAQLGN